MALNNPNNQPNQAPSNRQGTGFTNLQQLMSANQGNKLGQAVGAGIQQAGQQVQQGLQAGQQQFQQDSSANQMGTQAQKENVQNVLKDPSQVSDADVANFATYRAGQYGGPTDLSNIQSLQSQAQQAQQQGKAIGSEGGRQSLLQRYAAAPGEQYGTGAQRLDTMLLGATGAKPLQAARQSVSGLTSQVGGAEQAAQQQAQQYAQQAKGFGQQVTGQVQAGQQAIYNPAQATAQQANIAEQQGISGEQAAALQATQKNQLSADALKSLGLNVGDRTYGANLGEALGWQAQNEAANPLNVMTQPQFQQYTGLQKLMGQTPSGQQTAYQAGKTTYDPTKLTQDIAEGKTHVDPYEQSRDEAQKIMNVYTKYGLTGDPSQNPTYQATNQQGYDRDKYMAGIANAYNEIKQFAPGALGGGWDVGKNISWAQNELAKRQANLDSINAQYAGNVAQTDQDKKAVVR